VGSEPLLDTGALVGLLDRSRVHIRGHFVNNPDTVGSLYNFCGRQFKLKA